MREKIDDTTIGKWRVHTDWNKSVLVNISEIENIVRFFDSVEIVNTEINIRKMLGVK